MVYLDYSATSPLLPEAKMAMLSAMELTGNASALHTPGHLAMNAIEDAREEIAKLIGAEPEEILFTSGGTESNNTVTNIFAGQPIAVSAIEHPSLLDSAKLRCETIIIPVDKNGTVKKEIFETQFSGISATTGAGDRRSARDDGPRSRCPENSCLNISLASVMLANNEIGTINDIKSLAKTAHAHGALFHTDATQALGKVKINVKDLDVDYMTISSHKIGGPIGIGALYIKKGSPFTPFIIGGHQERGRRAGTYQTVNIAGFGAAAKYANDHKTWEIYQKKIRPLRDQLRERILKEIPYSSANTPDNSLPNILNCSFEAAEGESIQLYLDAEGDIITSTGSACASGDGKPSHVIMAVRNDAEIAHSSVRFSFGLDSTEKDVDHVMKYLPGIVDRLQKISTLKAGKIKKEDSYYGRK
ncbi:cysteine desulfurase [Candidatus Saccharibacteria bacterium]|nr:cysteine desulfurase [Candidatus Saccharibacteria bacterium]